MTSYDELHQKKQALEHEYKQKIEELVEWDREFYRHHTTYQHFDRPNELFSRHLQHKELMLQQREKIDAFYLNKINDFQYEIDLINCNIQHDKKISDLIHSYKQTKGGLYGDLRLLNKWDILNYKNISRIDFVAIQNLYREIDLLKKKAITQLNVIHNRSVNDIKKIKADRHIAASEVGLRIDAINKNKEIARAGVLNEYEKELKVAISQSKFDQKSAKYFKQVRALVGDAYKNRVLRNDSLKEAKVKNLTEQLEKFKNEKEGSINKLCDSRLSKYESKYQYLLDKENKHLKIIDDDFTKTSTTFDSKIKALTDKIAENNAEYDLSTNDLFERRDTIVAKGNEAVAKISADYEKAKVDIENEFRAILESHENVHREKDIDFKKREQAALLEHEKTLENAKNIDKQRQREFEQQKHDYIVAEENDKKIAHSEFRTVKVQIDQAVDQLSSIIDRFNKKREAAIAQEDKRYTNVVEKIKSTSYAPLASINTVQEFKQVTHVKTQIRDNEEKYNAQFTLATNIANTELNVLRDEYNVSKVKAGSNKDQLAQIEAAYSANVNRINASIKAKDSEIKVEFVEKLKELEADLAVATKALEAKQQEVAAANVQIIAEGKKIQDGELEKAAEEHLAKVNAINAANDEAIRNHEKDIRQHKSSIELHDNKLFENLKQIEAKYRGLHDTLKIKGIESEYDKYANIKISLERTHDDEYQKAVAEAEKVFRSQLSQTDKKFEAAIKKQEETNQKTIADFNVEELVKKSDKIRNTANYAAQVKIDALTAEFDQTKKNYEHDMSLVNKQIEKLNEHHNAYLSHFEKIVAPDIEKISNIYNQQIVAVEEQLAKIDATFDIRNKLDEKNYNEYLFQLTKEEDASILSFRKRVVRAELDELNKDFFEKNPLRAKQDEKQPDLWFQINRGTSHTWLFIGLISFLVGGLLFCQAQFQVLNKIIDAPNLWNQISNVLWPFSIIFAVIGVALLLPSLIFWVHNAARGAKSSGFRSRFNSKLDYLYYCFKIEETKYKYIQDFGTYRHYVNAKNLYLIERARIEHENMIRTLNAERQNEINHIIEVKPEYIFPRREKEANEAHSNKINFRNELLRLKHEYHLALIDIHQRQVQRYKFYMEKISTSDNKQLREQYREEYDLIKKTHEFNDQLDLQNEKRRFVNRYNDLCIKYKQVSNDNPIVKLGILKHNKMSEEFARVEKQTAATLALFNTRVEELERYNVTCGNFDERTKFEERTKFGILLTSVFAVLFVWIIIMAVVGIIYFPDVLDKKLFFNPLTNIHGVYFCVGVSFLILLISLLNTYTNYKRSLNVLAPDVDLYRLQEDKIAKLKKLNNAFNQKVSDLTALASEMERRNYGLAHEAYVESAKELELQMQRSDQAHALIHQQIHDYHNKQHQNQLLAHEAAVKGVHDMYAEQSSHLREQYNDIITRQQLAFEKYLMVLKGELGEDALDYAANEIYKAVSQHKISESLRKRINTEITRQGNGRVGAGQLAGGLGTELNDMPGLVGENIQTIKGVGFQLPSGVILDGIKFSLGEFIIPDGSSLAIGQFVTNDHQPVTDVKFYSGTGQRISDVHFIPSLEGSKTVTSFTLSRGRFVDSNGIPIVAGQFIGSLGQTLTSVSFVDSDEHTMFGGNVLKNANTEQRPIMAEEMNSQHVIIVHKRDDNGNWIRDFDKTSKDVETQAFDDDGTPVVKNTRTKKVIFDTQDADKTNKVIVEGNVGKTRRVKFDNSVPKTRKVTVDKEDIL